MTTEFFHIDADGGLLVYTMETGAIGMSSPTYSHPRGPESVNAIVFATPEHLIAIGRAMMELGSYLVDFNMGKWSELAGGDHGAN